MYVLFYLCHFLANTVAGSGLQRGKCYPQLCVALPSQDARQVCLTSLREAHCISINSIKQGLAVTLDWLKDFFVNFCKLRMEPVACILLSHVCVSACRHFFIETLLSQCKLAQLPLH